MHLLAGAGLAQDAPRAEPEPPEAEAGVRGPLQRGRHAAVCKDAGKGVVGPWWGRGWSGGRTQYSIIAVRNVPFVIAIAFVSVDRPILPSFETDTETETEFLFPLLRGTTANVWSSFVLVNYVRSIYL